MQWRRLLSMGVSGPAQKPVLPVGQRRHAPSRMRPRLPRSFRDTLASLPLGSLLPIRVHFKRPLAKAARQARAGLGSVGCVAAITKGDACDVCSTLHGAPAPARRSLARSTRCSQARGTCGRLVPYVASAPRSRRAWSASASTWAAPAMRTPWVGTGRYAMEHWVHSHPLRDPHALRSPWRRRGHDPARIGRADLSVATAGAADRRGVARRRRGARRAHPRPDPEETPGI